MENEGDVKKEVKKILKTMDADWFMPAANGFGRAGVSDIIVNYRGRFIAIETKFGKNKPTNNQMVFGRSTHEHGGHFLVISEKNLHWVEPEIRAFYLGWKPPHPNLRFSDETPGGIYKDVLERWRPPEWQEVE